MQLGALRVSHIPKNRGLSFDGSRSHAFFLDTCQRWVWISHSASSQLRVEEMCEGEERYEGRDAYLFLLRLATGLESKVLGETDIFGQMKQAWKSFEVTRPAHDYQVSFLSYWMQRVFEDTKEIRTRYLQNLGGSSYGTLLRKLLVSHAEGPVLLVGAGQIAQSVAPYLLDSEVWLTNRDPIRLCAFYEDLMYQFHSPLLKKLTDSEEEMRAWAKAKTIVLCIPLDPVQDPKRIQWFAQGGFTGRSVIHLGGQRGQCGDWETLPSFFNLTDLFQLQDTQGNVRSVQVLQAERACEERAKLRSLGGSISIPHGWEDLAVFA